MIKFAQILSKDFAFVRVDFLHDGANLFVGELTFTPASGLVQWNPPKYDIILGSCLKLPTKSVMPYKGVEISG